MKMSEENGRENGESDRRDEPEPKAKKLRFAEEESDTAAAAVEEDVAENEEEDADEEEEVTSFEEMGIDERILMSVVRLGWLLPTPIQEAAIPLFNEGKDILAQARTGSGKTGAYAIPLLNKILSMKKYKASKQKTHSLILTPSRELCSQAHKNLLELTSYCQREITVIDLSATQMTTKAQKQILATKPDVIISTPTKILEHLRTDANQAYIVDLKASLEVLVIDEADLLFSFGYEEDMKTLAHHLPKNIQTVLLSATLNEEVKHVRSLYLHNPAVLKLKESAQLPDPLQLEQYQISCANEEDKFVLLQSIFKLQLVRGKSLIFVNTVNRCYKLKIFLENFGIRSCVLNSELPINSRMHIIEQFNGGLYDILIASDEKFIDQGAEEGKEQAAKADENPAAQSKAKKPQANKRKDKEYNISRGIDFQHVSNVINFDFPATTKSYIHRVGRTARGTNKGTALSFVDETETGRLNTVEEELKETFNYRKNNESLESVKVLKQFKFKMDEIEGFRYRARDVLRSITSVAIKEARLKEIKNELLNSEKLKSYFEENPREMQVLRHDKELHVTKLDEHLKHVPDYIIPPSMRGIKLRTTSVKKNRHKNQKPQRSAGQKRFQKKNSDPLRSFNFAGIKKKKK